MRPSLQALLVATVAVALLPGCGGPERPNTVKVTGSVKLNGEPVSGAEVVFRSDNAARVASGLTDAQGNFSLTTFDTDDGAVPGEHTVTISKSDASDLDNISVDDPSADYGAAMEAAAAGDETLGGKVKAQLPAKYADPSKSGLKRTVSAEGPNEFNFNLE